MNLIPLFIIIPLAAAFLNSLLGKRIKRFSDVFSSLATLALLIISIYSVALVSKHTILVYKVGGWMPPFGISLVLDGLSSFMLVTVNVVSFFIALFSVNYMEKYTAKSKFYTLFLLMLAGMNGLIISGDLFNLFVFLEIASVSSYALVAFGTEAQEVEASFKYAIMSSVASSFILLGIAFPCKGHNIITSSGIGANLLNHSATLLIYPHLVFITQYSEYAEASIKQRSNMKFGSLANFFHLIF